MNQTSVPAQIEFRGVEQYSDAMQSVLDNASTIGFAVVRECFDADDITEYDYRAPNHHDMPHIVEELTQRELSRKIVATFWREQGFTDRQSGYVYEGNSALHHGRHGYTFDSRRPENKVIVNGIASFSGEHRLHVSPGMHLADPNTGKRSDARVQEDLKVLEGNKSFARQNRNGYLSQFAAKVILRPGDVALIMGQPQPAYTALAAQTRSRSVMRTSASRVSSYWGTFNYSTT